MNAPIQLKCEYAIDPVGIDALKPRLFWQMNDARRGARQTAYQIQVGSTEGSSDLWDTGKVLGDASTHVEYAGSGIASKARLHWRVRIWDGDGVASPFSAPACFEMGLLAPADWSAQWITADTEKHTVAGPAIYLRKAFELTNRVRSARLYLSARGAYVPFMNGGRVGADRLTPGWTDYHIRIPYQTYDVKRILAVGQNALGIILGDGWFAGQMLWAPRTCIYGDRPWAIAQLHIVFEDGSEQTVVSDDTWLASLEGPIRSQSFLNGDTIDVRGDFNFSAADFDNATFNPVRTSERDNVQLVAQTGPTVQQTGECVVKEKWTLPTGDHVFDLGQNMVGVVQLTITGRAGQTITLSHGEMLKGGDDRSVYTENLRNAKCTDTFILSGKTDQIEPLFTLHGFRYVQISGLESQQTCHVVGLVYHSNTPPTGEFSCSNEKLNQLQQNIVWGQRGNFIEVPTDCPQRDERLGWTGDAQVFIRTAAFNMDVAGFFNKWLRDMTDAQLPNGGYPNVVPDILTDGKMDIGGAGSPAWGDAGVICPWTLYGCYGDRRMLETNYASMCRYIDFLEQRIVGGHHPDIGFGDWLAIGSDTAKPLIGIAFSAFSVSLMQKIASVLERHDDSQRFAEIFARYKSYFNRDFVTQESRVRGDSQTAAVLALHFDLLDEPAKSRVARWLCDDIVRKGVITTGFVGCNLILPTLSQIGRNDLAWMLLSSERFPSWLFSVNQGATTIWERWDGWTPEQGFQNPGMNSFNHYAYGSCGQWMYAHIGGIDLAASGVAYKHSLLRPALLPELTSANASLQTLYGKLWTDWRTEADRFHFRCGIPANTSAHVSLPGRLISGDIENSLASFREGRTELELPAGEYRLVTTLDLQ